MNTIRLTNNRAVWKALSIGEQEQRRANNSDQRGANAVYGEKYKLSEAEQWELPPDEEDTFEWLCLMGGGCWYKCKPGTI